MMNHRDQLLEATTLVSSLITAYRAFREFLAHSDDPFIPQLVEHLRRGCTTLEELTDAMPYSREDLIQRLVLLRIKISKSVCHDEQTGCIAPVENSRHIATFGELAHALEAIPEVLSTIPETLWQEELNDCRVTATDVSSLLRTLNDLLSAQRSGMQVCTIDDTIIGRASNAVRNWISCVVHIIPQQTHLSAQARSERQHLPKSIRQAELKIELPDGSDARLFWNMQHRWYEIQLPTHSARALRIADQEFRLTSLGDHFWRVDTPGPVLARALSNAKTIQLGD
jgi:hypothetical protein